MESNIWDMMTENRRNEMKAICRFIDTATIEEMVIIIEEIRCCHDNLLTWNEDTGLLAKVESIALHGEFIQMNIEKDSE